jgi:hypothetical protein
MVTIKRADDLSGELSELSGEVADLLNDVLADLTEALDLLENSSSHDVNIADRKQILLRKYDRGAK